VVDLLIVGVVVAVPVLYATDRILKARAQARRLRTMSDRLAGATARADEQRQQRRAAAEAGATLTSVMPAIERPPLTLPPPRTGEHETRTPDRAGSAPRSPQPPG
jgi:hypothetical protein